MRILAMAVVVALIAPAPAYSQIQKTAARDPNEIICKSKPKVGTRFATKTCRTRAEWDEINEAAKRDAKELIDKQIPNYCDGQGCPGGG